MQKNSIFEPAVAIYQAYEQQAISFKRITVSAETQAVQKVTMVMLDVIDKAFAKHKSKFGDFDQTLKSIRLAMHGKYLSSVEIFGFHRKNRVLSLKISIDWDNLRILAQGANFKPFNSSLSPLAQVDDAIGIIISLLQHEVQNRKIDRFQSMYSFLTSNNPIENTRRVKDCGLAYLNDEDEADLNDFRRDGIGHAVSSDDVPGAVFRVIYRDSPMQIQKPSILDRLKNLLT